MKHKIVLILIFVLVVNVVFVQAEMMSSGYPEITSPSVGTSVIKEVGEEIDDRMWDKYGICKLIKGCYSNNEEGIDCFPYGYRKEGQYCSEVLSVHKSLFTNQLKTEESCNNSFECESNFCFNEKCVNKISSLIVNLIQRISALEDKSNVTTLDLEEIKHTIPKNETATPQPEEEQKRGIVGFIVRIFKR